MQVHPVEVWDLLKLLGLPPSWTAEAFVSFFDRTSQGSPSHDDFESLSKLFREVEAHFGEVDPGRAQNQINFSSKLQTKKILRALRDQAATPRRKLDAKQRKAALRLMRANTPVSRLISRHTRGLLRRYFEAGKISNNVATREVRDVFVEMTTAERDLYEAVENYISSTYNAANSTERNAVGFVMTIYRRRLASSFHALRQTLHKRLDLLTTAEAKISGLDEDVLDDEAVDETMDAGEAERLEKQARMVEERGDLEYLLQQTGRLPRDSKAGILIDCLKELQNDGFKQVMVFTQYTDTIYFLRDILHDDEGLQVICFSGRGGEVPASEGGWHVISRDVTKQRFRKGKAEIMLCTDAAAEGLNFQFCGALINYDMPWNPMRVEQRIGRIDRLGQKYPRIRIINLHYQNTVETDVYQALRNRISLFQNFVGKLQPILARLPKVIGEAALASKLERDRQRAQLVSELEGDILSAESSGFDLDQITDSDLEMPRRPPALYDFEALDRLIQRPELLPPGVEVESYGNREYKFIMPGMREPLRVTTDPDFFDQHPGSSELWSPGSPLFPIPEEVADPEQLKSIESLSALLRRLST